jgi:hypothetical protein
VSPALVVLSLLWAATGVAGAVFWSDELADPQGDVRDNLGGLAADRIDVDIRTVHIEEQGNDLNITLTLVGTRNSTAEYSVDLLADASNIYHMTLNGTFAATGPAGAIIPVTGHFSRDGRSIYWVIARSSISATSTLGIHRAMARLAVPGALVYTDTAHGGTVDIGRQLPAKVSVAVIFETLSSRNVTVTAVYEGPNATAVRTLLDTDADGLVSAAEAAVYVIVMRARVSAATQLPNCTLDGLRAVKVNTWFTARGLEGFVGSTEPVTFILTQTLEFSQPASSSSHEFVFDTVAIGGDEPWDDKFIGDDPWDDEFIGGDEPWENVFIGGDDPWEDEAIGGDEPWDDEVDVTFRLVLPEGWRLRGTTMPSGLDAYVQDGRSQVVMDPEGSRLSYASTMGRMLSMTVETEPTYEGPGMIPGTGAAGALAALVGVALFGALESSQRTRVGRRR